MTRSTSHHAVACLDVTAKAQRLGLCPSDRRDMSVQLAQPLVNEAVKLSEADSANDGVADLHWLDRLDGFLDQAREQLAKAPPGCRSFDFEVVAIPSGEDLLQPLRLGIHVEVARRWRKHVLLFSLGAGTQEGMATMPTFDEMHSFLREHYLHSRFEGRNAWYPKGVQEGGTYADLVIRSHLEHLEKYGHGWIGMYECRLGRAIKYDKDLTILNPDAPPAQIQRRAGHLTHLFD